MSRKAFAWGALFAIILGIVTGFIILRFFIEGDFQYMLFSAITGILGALSIAAGSFLYAYIEKDRKAKEAPTLEDRITSLTENLKSSSSVISEIEVEIDKRRDIAEKLKKDVQWYGQLKQMTQSQVEAIAQAIRSEISVESRKSIWRNAVITFVIALAFFFLGFWLRGI